MNPYLINECTENEVDTLAKIGADTFYETFIAYNTKENIEAYIQKAYATQNIQQFIKNNLGGYYLAYQQQQAVGYIKLINGLEQPQKIELEKIYVYQTHHGKGVANMLMEQAIAYAKKLNAAELFLGVWQENLRACAFYKKFGFEVYDTREFTLGSRICHDYMMKLKL